MLARKHEQMGEALPEEVLNNYNQVINEVYGAQARARALDICLYGHFYADELVLIASVRPVNGESCSCVTFLLSADLNAQQAQKKLFDEALNACGHFLDQYFDQDQWEDFVPRWEKIQWQGNDYFYQISREDLAAFLAAEKLLADNP